ncbi:hypothetical protein AAFF_G00366170 [Aldrovandia affinis]|uniref:Uncharacterized protein n=1 Tax=Aldrovandia affinis TaxID=143900 RepID=A0AAD7SHB8_9TELE|nr:hypothetical protein AAFF_G00366170 [Aldrovandia affinis]
MGSGNGIGDGGERMLDEPNSGDSCNPSRDEGNPEGEERGRDRGERDRDRDRDRRRSHREKDRDRDRERRRGDRDREHKRDRGDRERGGDRREERQPSQGQEVLSNGEDASVAEDDSQNGTTEQESEQCMEGGIANENGHMIEPQAEEGY